MNQTTSKQTNSRYEGHPADAALRRLIAIARNDTGQSRRVADFLLAWWNAHDWGRFDFTDVWGCDLEIGQDILTLLVFIFGHYGVYPDEFGVRQEIEDLIDQWRGTPSNA